MIAPGDIGPEVNRVDFWHDFLKLTKKVINMYNGKRLAWLQLSKFSFIIGILSHCYTDLYARGCPFS